MTGDMEEKEGDAVLVKGVRANPHRPSEDRPLYRVRSSTGEPPVSSGLPVLIV